MTDQLAYVITGRRTISPVDAADVSEVLPDHVVVEIAYTGICGSDVHAYEIGFPYHPTLSGHEWSGTVIGVGADVTGLEVGQRVARTSQPPCGRCVMCQAGHHARCENYTISSLPTAPPHGGYTPKLAVPARSVIALPDSVSLEQGALVEPLTVALHAVRRRQPRLGDTVVVIGAGLIGLATMQFAKLAGATEVVMVARGEDRRDLAARLGATTVLDPADPQLASEIQALTGGRGVDIAYECAGNAQAIQSATTLLRPGGTLMLVGTPFAPVELIPAMWMAKELDVQTTLAHNRWEFDITVDLLAKGLLRTDGMTDSVRGLSELADVFDELSGGAKAIKTLIDPRE
ncbi:zinc-dependent alcohol dehydrogenase [Microbacterium thalassium]|uniref:(R,R)-butanediol dehydrogenase/meso-butanediol dehydrogenase/diacetyl reductase n=1 Tax=Microbacterium thalassium TaxID=362649 RepID=A0A7X0FN52_9MICO|nr:zinc-binding dehydrogenase [Microbacterium thalassium]MBB6390516.1 (R,R)-butanediol dehydrogenase/meso-butanediol dehydrogenase/diacetyl reductase [Microbacterium thalassium]GLK25627.1 galactitol-1-phosphate 5-dehydrogenase [Microbacterium thalassium]